MSFQPPPLHCWPLCNNEAGHTGSAQLKLQLKNRPVPTPYQLAALVCGIVWSRVCDAWLDAWYYSTIATPNSQKQRGWGCVCLGAGAQNHSESYMAL